MGVKFFMYLSTDHPFSLMDLSNAITMRFLPDFLLVNSARMSVGCSEVNVRFNVTARHKNTQHEKRNSPENER